MARRIPKLCRHKASNRAYATDPFTGREHFFGVWGSPESQAGYDAWVRALLDRRKEVASGAPAGSQILIATLIADFLAYAEVYYRKGGKPTAEVKNFRRILRPVNEMFGTLAVDAFGPAELKRVRQWMIDKGWVRTSINGQVQRLCRVWKWGVEHGLVTQNTHATLKAVAGLRKGRTAAAESDPVGPVPLPIVEATLPRLAPDVRAMVETQLYADMRPGEVCIMRPCDLERSQVPWLYVPHTHKTEHHGKQRRIYLGPKARAVLAPFLLRCPAEDAWLFPSRAVGKHRGKSGHWTEGGYAGAIQKACAQEPSLPAWSPNQLRHTQTTSIREQYGIEGAQHAAGHAKMQTTEIYAERIEKLCREIAEKLG